MFGRPVSLIVPLCCRHQTAGATSSLHQLRRTSKSTLAQLCSRGPHLEYGTSSADWDLSFFDTVRPSPCKCHLLVESQRREPAAKDHDHDHASQSPTMASLLVIIFAVEVTVVVVNAIGATTINNLVGPPTDAFNLLARSNQTLRSREFEQLG